MTDGIPVPRINLQRLRLGFLPFKHYAARWCLCKLNTGQAWQVRLKLFPKPDHQNLARRVTKLRNIVEKPVIELFNHIPEYPSNLREVYDPARLGVRKPLHIHSYSISMAVNAAALVLFRHRWQEVGRIKRSFFVYSDSLWWHALDLGFRSMGT